MTTRISLQKVNGKWLGVIYTGNKMVTGTAINAEITSSEQLNTFEKAASFIRATRPFYATAEFFEVM